MLFRISYMDRNDNIDHKAFKDTKEAMDWVNQNTDITPLKLLVWDENINCFSTLYKF